MKTPLWEAVDAYLRRDAARFHMPGHKGQGDPFLQWDITEVAGCDSLYEASGPLRELEEELAKLYGARRTLLSAGGATLCIQTMLALACPPGGKVIAGRGCHRAAVSAMALLDLKPVWIYPDESAGAWFAGRYQPQAVETALKAHPDAAAVYLTSPDYFGVVSDLSGIAKICRQRGVPLLVDNAHGAHLKFLPEPNHCPHPIDCGVSICCDSLHKTLPAMTGGALLQIGEDRFIEQAKERMALFGSTSPSYPILLSCEQAAAYAASGKAEKGFARTIEAFDRMRYLLREEGIPIPQGPADPARLSLAFGALGLSAEAFGAYLRGQGVEPEYVSGVSCVLLGNGLNRPEDFLRLEAALQQLAKAPAPGALAPAGACAPPAAPTHSAGGVSRRMAAAPPAPPVFPHPVQACSIRQALFGRSRKLPVKEALGRVAAQIVSSCPPGIPVVMPGEQVDRQTQDALEGYGIVELAVLD